MFVLIWAASHLEEPLVQLRHHALVAAAADDRGLGLPASAQGTDTEATALPNVKPKFHYVETQQVAKHGLRVI